MKYFRVKTGYGKTDFLSVDETEVAQALRAQITGKVAVFSEGSVSGNSIMTITPDYQRLMGWNAEYALTGEDFDEIGKKRMNEYKDFLIGCKLQVDAQLRSGPHKLPSA